MSRRIKIIPFEEHHISEEYLSWFNDEDVIEFSGGKSKNLSKDDVLNYIKYGKETGTYFMYAIIHLEDNIHIGNIKIGDIDIKNSISDLATIIGNTKYWGMGLATESIILAQDYAFKKYKFRKLSGRIIKSNIGSFKAYTKAGWEVEGILKDHIIVNGKIDDVYLVSKFNKIYS